MMVLIIIMKLVTMASYLKKRSNSPSWRSGATITASSPTFASWFDDDDGKYIDGDFGICKYGL